jgi:hypothetical protein
LEKNLAVRGAAFKNVMSVKGNGNISSLCLMRLNAAD